MSDETKATRIKVAALWKNQKDGREYVSGNWGGTRILIFPNGFKERDEQPDFYMYLAARPPPGNARESDPR